MGLRGTRSALSVRYPPPPTHTHTCCHDLNLVNTLKCYYDHISCGSTRTAHLCGQTFVIPGRAAKKYDSSHAVPDLHYVITHFENSCGFTAGVAETLSKGL
jgi:hypothetical protein